MIFQLGARVDFRDASTGAPVADDTGFIIDMETTRIKVNAPATTHEHWWEPRDGIRAKLIAGVRRLSADGAGTGRIGGVVRFYSVATGEEVGTPVSFSQTVTMADLTTNDRVVATQEWSVTAAITGRLRVGVRLPPPA